MKIEKNIISLISIFTEILAPRKEASNFQIMAISRYLVNVQIRKIYNRGL